MKNEGKYCKKNVTKNYPQKPYIFLYKKRVKQIKRSNWIDKETHKDYVLGNTCFNSIQDEKITTNNKW